MGLVPSPTVTHAPLLRPGGLVHGLGTGAHVPLTPQEQLPEGRRVRIRSFTHSANVIDDGSYRRVHVPQALLCASTRVSANERLSLNELIQELSKSCLFVLLVGSSQCYPPQGR